VSDSLCGQFILGGVPNNNRSDEGPEFVPAAWERDQVSGEGFSALTPDTHPAETRADV